MWESLQQTILKNILIKDLLLPALISVIINIFSLFINNRQWKKKLIIERNYKAHQKLSFAIENFFEKDEIGRCFINEKPIRKNNKFKNDIVSFSQYQEYNKKSPLFSDWHKVIPYNYYLDFVKKDILEGLYSIRTLTVKKLQKIIKKIDNLYYAYDGSLEIILENIESELGYIPESGRKFTEEEQGYIDYIKGNHWILFLKELTPVLKKLNKEIKGFLSLI